MDLLDQYQFVMLGFGLSVGLLLVIVLAGLANLIRLIREILGV